MRPKSVCLSVCVSLASDSSETIIYVIIIKLGTVAATDMRMHHVLILLTLTFIQGHMYPNKNNKCSVILETVQAMPITFAVRIVWGKVYISFSQSDDLALHSRSQLCLKLYKCLTYAWHIMLMCMSMTLTLLQGHSGSAKAKESTLNYLDN